MKAIQTDFINAIERLLLKGHKIAHYVIESNRKWIDVDSLDRLEVAKRIFRVGGKRGAKGKRLRAKGQRWVVGTNYEL